MKNVAASVAAVAVFTFSFAGDLRAADTSEPTQRSNATIAVPKGVLLEKLTWTEAECTANKYAYFP